MVRSSSRYLHQRRWYSRAGARVKRHPSRRTADGAAEGRASGARTGLACITGAFDRHRNAGYEFDPAGSGFRQRIRRRVVLSLLVVGLLFLVLVRRSILNNGGVVMGVSTGLFISRRSILN